MRIYVCPTCGWRFYCPVSFNMHWQMEEWRDDFGLHRGKYWMNGCDDTDCTTCQLDSTRVYVYEEQKT